MKRRNIRLFIYLLSLSCFMCLSCTEDESYDFPGDSKNRVYIKSLNNIVNESNRASLDITRTPTNVISGVLKYSVFSTIKANGEIGVLFSIDNSLVDSYNMRNKTSYKEISQKVINLQNSELKIPSNSTISEDMLEIGIHADAATDLEAGEYLLPITIGYVTGNAEVSSNRNTIYILLNVYEDLDNIWDTNTTSKDHLLDVSRADWTVNTMNSSFLGDTKKMFDGDIYSYTQYSISSYDNNTGFIVDLKQEYSNISGVHQYYYDAGYAVKNSDIYTSLDGEDWTYQGHYKSFGGSISDICFYSPVKARYIKTIVVRTASEYVYIKELNIYVK